MSITYINWRTASFKESTVYFQLDKFFYLAEDGVWGVRKACAECFSQVSCACSPEYRHKELAEVFVALLYDASRWVGTQWLKL